MRAPPRTGRRPRSRAAPLRTTTAPRRTASPSTSHTFPRATVALAISALLAKRAATTSSSSAADQGPVEVADRDLDLDLRLEQRRALQVGVRWPLLRGATCKGRSSASRMEAAAVAASPWARRTRARPGWGIPPPRVRPAGLPPPRPRCLPCEVGSVRARSAAIRALAASTGAVPRRPRATDLPHRRTTHAAWGVSARWTRQRPWRLPMAFVSHHRSIASVHSSATSYWARPCNTQTSSQ